MTTALCSGTHALLADLAPNGVRLARIPRIMARHTEAGLGLCYRPLRLLPPLQLHSYDLHRLIAKVLRQMVARRSLDHCTGAEAQILA